MAEAAGEAASDIRKQLAGLLPELRAYARFLLRDRAHADDLVQDSVLKALGALGQFEAGTSLKAWVFTIQRNAFLEQTRRRQREARAMQTHAHTSPGELQPHHGGVSDMSRMLWSLPPLLREALVLVGAQELTHEEAAAICGIPVGTMRARVSRGRARLQEVFGAEARPWEG